jgi:hypothetical protein
MLRKSVGFTSVSCPNTCRIKAGSTFNTCQVYLVLDIRQDNNIIPFEIHMNVASIIIKMTGALFRIDFLCVLTLTAWSLNSHQTLFTAAIVLKYCSM